MGREIRYVPPNWEHPKLDNGNYKPLYDQTATEWFIEWHDEYREFLQDGLVETCKEHGYDPKDPFAAFCDYYGSMPDPDLCRPHFGEEATWLQVYETVSEGTPVSPPFESPEKLIDYLVENGDFWDQERRASPRISVMNCDPWPRERAERFVKAGHSVSLVVDSKGVRSGVEALDD